MTNPNMTIQETWKLLDSIYDPEVPVLSIVDLGIVRALAVDEKKHAVTVTITPTYSGCPAMDVIRMQIRLVLLENGFRDVLIDTVLSPAWSTAWMSEAGKDKLKAYGIAPPNAMQQVCHTELFQQEEAIECPLCRSYNTRLISQFGSTACKALYQCNNCLEPFDYFKCH